MDVPSNLTTMAGGSFDIVVPGWSPEGFPLTWDVAGVDQFFSWANDGNDLRITTILPDSAAGNTYNNVQITATDPLGNSRTETTTFSCSPRTGPARPLCRCLRAPTFTTASANR